MRNSLKAFFPSFKQITRVYSLQVFLINSWVIILFCYDLPRWMRFLSPIDIFSIFSYSIVSAFIDSLLFSGILLLLGFLVYQKFLKDSFVPVLGSTAITSYLWIITIRFIYQPELRNNLVWVDDRFPIWLTISIVSTILIGYLTYWNKKIQTIFHQFAERTLAFLYIYLPMSILCILVVVLRNLI